MTAETESASVPCGPEAPSEEALAPLQTAYQTVLPDQVQEEAARLRAERDEALDVLGPCLREMLNLYPREIDKRGPLEVAAARVLIKHGRLRVHRECAHMIDVRWPEDDAARFSSKWQCCPDETWEV